MKKIASLLLALAMLLSLCSFAEEGTELSIIWWGNQVRNERTVAALDLYSEQNPGVTFDPQAYVWADYWSKIATGALTDELPDIIQNDYAYLIQYADAGKLVDLTPYIESGALDCSNVSSSILDAGKGSDGGIYALCIGVNAPALIYNETLLTANDIEVPEYPTYEEFIDICREVYEKTGVKTNYGNDSNLLKCFLREKDELLYQEDSLGGTKEDYQEYFETFVQPGIEEGWLINWSFVSERVGNEQDPIVYGATPDQQSWCCFSWSNMVESYQAVTEDHLAMMPYPANDPEKSDFLKPSQFFSIAANSKNIDEAVKVLNFWTNSVEANDILLAERGIPVSSVVAEAIKPNVSTTQQEVFDFVNNIVTPRCTAINPADGTHAGEAEDTFSAIYEELCLGQLTIEEAAEKFDVDGNKVMAGEVK